MTEAAPLHPTPASPTAMAAICADLDAETADLVRLLEPLSAHEWGQLTPAEGWTIADTVAHLAYFDGTAILATTDGDAFTRHAAEVLSRPDLRAVAHEAAAGRRGPELLDWWLTERTPMVKVFQGLSPKARVPWYGPPMAATSFATARLMETWAHGQDVADTVGHQRPPSDRLRHVAHIGVRARHFSYATNGRAVPDGSVRVVLNPPGGGDSWVWNTEASDDVVRGDALDFCLVVTQRRHVADTSLEVSGALAAEWIAIAQAFAGPPGSGRKPGQFAER